MQSVKDDVIHNNQDCCGQDGTGLDRVQYERQINLRVTQKARGFANTIILLKDKDMGKIRLDIQIDDSTELNESYPYLMTSSTVEKCYSILEQKIKNARKAIKLTEKAIDLSSLNIHFETMIDISVFLRSIKKLNTNNLVNLSLCELNMTLKDVIRLMHH